MSIALLLKARQDCSSLANRLNLVLRLRKPELRCTYTLSIIDIRLGLQLNGSARLRGLHHIGLEPNTL